ncbi:hypothetical protein [Alteribacter populi]|uniref:hypothetical protein n=1 Tax=Alteribacter populi TaxID=2011011 RepID=UPI000BBA6539|nr:hypothetical protein [Alteribacter populi]
MRFLEKIITGIICATITSLVLSFTVASWSFFSILWFSLLVFWTVVLPYSKLIDVLLIKKIKSNQYIIANVLYIVGGALITGVFIFLFLGTSVMNINKLLLFGGIGFWLFFHVNIFTSKAILRYA